MAAEENSPVPGVAALGSAVAGGHGGPLPRRRLRRQVRKPGERRPVERRVKLTVEQDRQLVAAAEEQGITPARLLAESALHGGPAAAARMRAAGTEMIGIQSLLGRVGTNINQLARVANSTGVVPDGLPGALAAIERVCARIDAWLDETGYRRQ
jgi:hypothetical protein